MTVDNIESSSLTALTGSVSMKEEQDTDTLREQTKKNAVETCTDERACESDKACENPTDGNSGHSGEALDKSREESIQKFASCLKASTEKSSNENKKDSQTGDELQRFFEAGNVEEDSGLCEFPSLDLYSGEISALPLPSVGKSTKTGEDESKPKPQVPAMSASVFSTAAKPATDAASANANAVVLEQAAARNLSTVTTWKRSSLQLAPMSMLRALSKSFSSLVDARIRAWILLLLRHSLSRGDEQSRSHLLKLLATSHSIDVQSFTTSFQALPLPEKMKNTVSQENENKNEVILPLIFEVVANIVFNEEHVRAKVRAPGTIAGTFIPDGNLLTFMKINLDTNALVVSMVEQARLVVFKAVARATSTTVPTPSAPLRNKQTLLAAANAVSHKSINSTSTDFTPSFHISRPSPKVAMRSGSSVSEEGYDERNGNKPPARVPSALLNSSSLRKHRNVSVKWNTTVEVSQQNFNEPASSGADDPPKMNFLKSSKSFGRPDANTFSTSRNATFAEFGRGPMSAVNPVMPGVRKNIKNANFSMANLSSMAGGAGMAGNANVVYKKNAVFSAASVTLTQKLSQLSTTSGGAGAGYTMAGLSAKPSSRRSSLGQMEDDFRNVPQPSLPRTPTALEGLLLAKAAQRNL